MTILRWSAAICFFGILAAFYSGCIVSGGYGEAVDVDYYEPVGVYVGGWGPDYLVGPYRDHGHRIGRDGGRPSGHAYRPAPASHSIPSLPARGGSGGGGRIR